MQCWQSMGQMPSKQQIQSNCLGLYQSLEARGSQAGVRRTRATCVWKLSLPCRRFSRECGRGIPHRMERREWGGKEEQQHKEKGVDLSTLNVTYLLNY